MRHLAGRAARALFVVAVIVALVFFARTVNWTESWRAVKGTSPAWLVAAAVANIVSVALKGVRWWVFLRPIGVTSLGLSLRAFFAGAALNSVLIANSGEAARVVLVSRAANAPSARVLATLLLERFFETFGYVLLLATAATFISLPPSLVAMRPFAYAGLVAMLALLVYLARRSDGAVIRSEEKDLQLSLRDRVRRYGREFVDAVSGISSAPRFAVATLVTVAVWALQFLSYHWTAVAADFPMPLVASLAALLAVNVSFAIRATPGNVGVFQAIYALTATYFGLDKDAAIGVALLIQTQQQIPVILLGVLSAPGVDKLRFLPHSGDRERAGR